MPNLSDRHPGDLILVEASGLSGAGITAVQTLTNKPAMASSANWTHAAVYVGNGKVVDASFPAGVAEQPLWTYAQRRSVTVRRIDDPSVPIADIRQIAPCAQRHIGESYSVLQAILAKLGIAMQPNPQGLYCSTFAGLVIAEATGIRLWSHPKYQPFYPAMIASHPDLHTVPLEWCER